jgi:hypothetical protein
MAKRYTVTVGEGERAKEHTLYVGQVWMNESCSDFRKITKFSTRKGQRLRISYREKATGVDAESPSKDCDLDDFILWILDSDYKPLVISYEEQQKQ